MISPGHFQTLLLCRSTSSVLTGEFFVSSRRGQIHNIVISLTRFNDVGYKYVLLHYNNASVLYNMQLLPLLLVPHWEKQCCILSLVDSAWKDSNCVMNLSLMINSVIDYYSVCGMVPLWYSNVWYSHCDIMHMPWLNGMCRCDSVIWVDHTVRQLRAHHRWHLLKDSFMSYRWRFS